MVASVCGNLRSWANPTSKKKEARSIRKDASVAGLELPRPLPEPRSLDQPRGGLVGVAVLVLGQVLKRVRAGDDQNKKPWNGEVDSLRIALTVGVGVLSAATIRENWTGFTTLVLLDAPSICHLRARKHRKLASN